MIKLIAFTFAFLTFNLKGQDCMCNIFENYNDTSLQVLNDQEYCYKNCKIVVESISMLHKLNDFHYWKKYNDGLYKTASYTSYFTRPIPSQYYKNKEGMIEYLNFPLKMLFLESDTILENDLLIMPVFIQKIIIYNDINISKYGISIVSLYLGGKNDKYFSIDTVYRVLNVSEIMLISSRVYNSDISTLIKSDLLNLLKSKDKIKDFQSLEDLYIKFLILRKIKFIKTKNHQYILSQFRKNKDVKLTKDNIKPKIIELINGNIDW